MDDDHPGYSPARSGEGAQVWQGDAPPRDRLEGPAARALAEAEARRLERRRTDRPTAREINGRQGPEPVRYGDWENKGIASDF